MNNRMFTALQPAMDMDRCAPASCLEQHANVTFLRAHQDKFMANLFLLAIFAE